ncbi:MAG: hypothetical protein QXH42_06210 [Thermoplasmata archaeon]
MSAEDQFRPLTRFFLVEGEEGNKTRPTGAIIMTYELSPSIFDEELFPKMTNVAQEQFSDEISKAILRERLKEIPIILVVDRKVFNNIQWRQWTGNILVLPLFRVREAHLKIWVATFSDRIRLAIGSANLTEQGLGIGNPCNLESQVWFEWPRGGRPRVDARDLARFIKQELLKWAERVAPGARRHHRLLEEVACVLRKKAIRGSGGAKVLLSWDLPLETKLNKYAGPARGVLKVVSPYFSAGPDGAIPLLNRRVHKLRLYTEPAVNGIHAGMTKQFLKALPDGTEFFELRRSGDLRGRVLHSKIYFCDSWLVIGSANFTHAGWRTAALGSPPGNLEAVCVFKRPTEYFKSRMRAMVSDEYFEAASLPRRGSLTKESVNESIIGCVFLDASSGRAVVDWSEEPGYPVTLIWPGARTVHRPPNWSATLSSTGLKKALELSTVRGELKGGVIELQLIIYNEATEAGDAHDGIPLDFWFEGGTPRKTTSSEREQSREPTAGKTLGSPYISIAHHIKKVGVFYRTWRRFFPVPPSTQRDRNEIAKILDKYIATNNLIGNRAELLREIAGEVFGIKLGSSGNRKLKPLVEKGLRLLEGDGL